MILIRVGREIWRLLIWRAVERADRIEGSQMSGAERLGPTAIPRMEEEGEMEEGGQRGGRTKLPGGGGEMEQVMEDLGGLSSPPKALS
jgi:hypothetical protein